MAPNIDFTKDRAEDVTSTHRLTFGQYFGPTAYVTGGDPCRPGDLKLGAVQMVLFEIALDQNNANPKALDYDEDGQVIRWYELTTGAEVANGTNLSLYDARFCAVGR